MTQFYYFSTAWCAPCKSFKPVVQEVVAENGIPMQFVDAQQNQALAQQYGVTSVPTIVVANNGQVAFRHTGVMAKSQLAKALSGLQ